MNKNLFLLTALLGFTLLTAACTPGALGIQPPLGTPNPDSYGYASDYSWLKGQVLITAAQGGCTYLVYNPQLNDQYGGRVILSGETKGLVNNALVTVKGSMDTSGAKQVCPGATNVYTVTSVASAAPDASINPPATVTAVSGSYGYAPDYSWLKGQVRTLPTQAGCMILVYDPKGADSYGGKVILTGATDGLKNGANVTVKGTLDTSGTKQVCPGASQVYIVDSVEGLIQSTPEPGPGPVVVDATQEPDQPVNNGQVNVGTGGSDNSVNSGAINGGGVATVGPDVKPPAPDAYSHAADYAWLKGIVQVTAIQSGCTYLIYDPSGADAHGGKVALVEKTGGALKAMTNDEWVTVNGAFDLSAPRVVCPGSTDTYYVTGFAKQP